MIQGTCGFFSIGFSGWRRYAHRRVVRRSGKGCLPVHRWLVDSSWHFTFSSPFQKRFLMSAWHWLALVTLVCQICLPILVYILHHITNIYIYTYTLVNLLWQRFFGEVYEYRGNFMGQFLRSAGLTCCSVNGDSVSRCTQVIPVGDGNTGGASWKRFGDPGPHIFLGTEASKTEPL